ncbi:hypothetical protein, partial [Methanoregula sp.]|uniref:hypothetical protein n=1 Tax=Methanoregula sp. TaxID=2052170 RepID=UPI0025F405ED
DILLGFEPKDAGSIPAGSANFFFGFSYTDHSVRSDPAWFSLPIEGFSHNWRERSGIWIIIETPGQYWIVH